MHHPSVSTAVLLLFPLEDYLAQASTVLLLLGSAVLVYRSFRGRYLLTWILGWLAYLVHKFAAAASIGHPALHALSGVMYVVAITLFAFSVFLYTDHSRWLRPVGAVSAVALALTIIGVFLLPGSGVLAVLLMALYAVIRGAAAIHLALFTRGRRAVGPILLVVSLLFLHMHEPGMSDLAVGMDMALELLLGIGMVVIVLDDSQERSRRLQALNALTTAIAEARDFVPIVHSALQNLRALTLARGAWFRVLDGDQLVLIDQVGVSEEYARSRRSLPLATSFSGQVIRKGEPGMIRRSQTDPEVQRRLAAEGFDHVMVIPVHGKSSPVGVVSLGVTRPRNYRAEEMEFFSAMANQLGIAVENQRLLNRIVQSQKRWANTFDSIQDWVLVHDESFHVIKVNQALAARLGIDAAQLGQRTCDQLLPGVGSAWQAWQGCPYCWRPSEFDSAPDPCFGGYSRVSTSSYNEQETRRVGTVHIIKDVTEHLAMEERYRLLFEQVEEGVFISTPEGRLLDCNAAFVRMLGYERKEDVLQLDIAKSLYAEPEVRSELLRRIDQKGYLRSFEITLRRKDGSTIPVLETSFARRGPDGQVVTYQGFLLDMTEKKRAEDEIRRHNRELSALNTIAVAATQSFELDEILKVTLEQVADLLAADTGSVHLFEEERQVLRRRAAHGHRSPLGTGLQEMQFPREFWRSLQDSRLEVITEKDRPHLPEVVTRYVEAEGLQSWMWVLLWTKDKAVGLLGVASRSARVYSSAEQELLVAVGRQLATTIQKIHLYHETLRAYEELTRTQEQLLQSEKMSAVGQLISGVAHELNNPLTAILGYAQLLESEEIPARAQDFVQKLYKQAQRTHKIVQNLLSFSRQRKPQRQQVDLQRVVEDTLALRDYDMKLSNISVERDFQRHLPPVMGDEHQLEQVFLNIINNAVDAVLEHAREGTLYVRIYAENGEVCVEFHDSGPGIKDPKRIFDPFYTTKSVGKGTGLGLSICYGIVKEHGGNISARNHDLGGAVFQVRLPALPAAEEQLATATRRESPLRGRVLLLDDEESVLEFEREVLRAAGAEVCAFTDAEGAMARLRGESFDAILVDGKMPGSWNGMEIYHWLRINRPGLEKSVVLALSNVNDPEVRQFLEQAAVAYLAKPFSVADLVATIQRVLQSRTLKATV